jgi:hypothetical protein
VKFPESNEAIGKKPVSEKEKLPPPTEFKLMVEKLDVRMPSKLKFGAFDRPAADGLTVIVMAFAPTNMRMLKPATSAAPFRTLVQSLVGLMVDLLHPLSAAAGDTLSYVTTASWNATVARAADAGSIQPKPLGGAKSQAAVSRRAYGAPVYAPRDFTAHRDRRLLARPAEPNRAR